MSHYAAKQRVGFHLFQTYAQHPGKDGSNLAYNEIGHLIFQANTLEPCPHNLLHLCQDDKVAFEHLSKCDVVVATVGPHAYLYFYLREKFGLNFRIIRDVRTALWNGYILQEVLSAPYLRPDDSIIHSSAYSRALYQHLFPHLSPESQHICYPLLRWFPVEIANAWKVSQDRRVKVIGYVGRLTDDKNFTQVLDVFAELRRCNPGEFALIVVGEGHGKYGHTEVVKRLNGDLTGYKWVPTVDNKQIWSHYKEFDVLLFPSTSTLETFGRVLVEASYIGVPILASTHGAASELIDPTALIPTNYTTDRDFTTHFAAPLGKVDAACIAAHLQSRQPIAQSVGHTFYENDDKKFLIIISQGNKAKTLFNQREANHLQNQFINSVNMTGLVLHPSTDWDAIIERLRTCFVALHKQGCLSYYYVLFKFLVCSRYPKKTWNFIKRSIYMGEDFTNIGGIDLQFSHLIQFYPSFRLLPFNTSFKE